MIGNDADVGRRAMLLGAAATSIALMAPPLAIAADPDADLVTALFGKAPLQSEKLRLDMPPRFANGYTVPLALEVESAMTETDHPRAVHILAPSNPFLRVATFHFTPGSGKASISTRIRLAKPQNVIAVAEMSNGTILMSKRWVVVEIDGCA